MTQPRATYFSIDIETNGPVPGLYDMVSLGVVVLAHGDDGELQLGQELYLEIRPQAPRIDPHAVQFHGLTLDHLNEHGIPRREAAGQLAEWVAAQTRPGTQAVFVGHNAPFDWSFIAWTYSAEDLRNPFGYKGLCTKALATGVLGLHWLDSDKERICTMLGLPPEDMGQKHRADYDARLQAQILRGLLLYER